MTSLDRLRMMLVAVLTGSTDSRIAIRQLVVELRKQVPTLYGLLCTNACALAVTHAASHRISHPRLPPAVVIPVCVVRTIRWVRLRPERLTDAEALRQLRSTSILTAVFSVAFTTWAMALNAYGGPYEQGHVAFFVGHHRHRLHLLPDAPAHRRLSW